MCVRPRAGSRLSRRRLLTYTIGTAAALTVACSPVSAPAPTAPSKATSRKPADVWNGPELDTKVLRQLEIDKLPEPPFMLRVTELEMAPGASIDPRTHLGPGVQVVLSGAFTIIDARGTPTVYEPTADTPFPVFYSGMAFRYSSENRGPTDNRLFIAEILPQSRGFLGNQQFDVDGVTHNRGGVRSGPYVQEKIDKLPDGPLMIRVSQIDMGPKGKTPEYTRPGPAIFFVSSGQATFRRQDELFIATQGAGGYYFDDGSRPIILENKPITPNRLVAIEILPASLGKQPSTTPTGREL